MIYLYNILFFLFFSLSVLAQETPRTIIAASDPSNKTVWELHSPDGFTLVKQEKKIIREREASKDLRIAVKAGKLYCNGKKVSTDRLLVVAQSGSMSMHDIAYSGLMMVARKNDHFVLVHLGDVQGDGVKVTVTPDAPAIDKHPIVKSKKKARDFTVRVLLDEKKELRSEPWILESADGFIISDPRQSKQNKTIDMHKIAITVKRDGMIYINNKPCYMGQVLIQPRAQTTWFIDNEYRGPMWIVVNEDGVKIINCIGLEDYVESVLCTESWPGWPLEINKVCAVASRTYVIAMVQRAKASKCLYHIRNTNKHQTYTGGNASAIVKQAVRETEGVFITYKKQPITAMFDICCGGVITANMQGVDFVGSPYLARTYACTYCKNCKSYSWKARYDLQELERILKDDDIHVRRLRDVKVTKKDKAGMVQQVMLKGSGHHHHVSGKKIYSLLKKVKSFCYSIERQGDQVVFNGRGTGHHLGLCQWGAREMVRDGIDFKSVLAFYYPGTQLMRLV